MKEINAIVNTKKQIYFGGNVENCSSESEGELETDCFIAFLGFYLEKD